MKKQAIVINSQDNVATAVENLTKGTSVEYTSDQNVKTVILLEAVPFGHKLAVKDISKDQDIVKYGESIGSALDNIKPGEHVHVHNMESKRGRGDKQ